MTRIHCVSLTGWRGGCAQPMEVPVRDLVLAGWTGRDPAHVEAHIRELAALGIPPPAKTPVFYRVASTLLTTDCSIEVIGTDSTGEVEFLLLNHGGEIWVGVGSDHTDRKMEAIGITASKQLCRKPISPEVWCLPEVEPHWDQLRLRSYAHSNGRTELYQEENLAALRHPRNLIELYDRTATAPFREQGTVIFSGTPATLEGFRWADKFIIELEDPVLGRCLKHEYTIRSLEIAD